RAPSRTSTPSLHDALPTANSSGTLDFRGCANDPETPQYYTLPDGTDPDGQRTVTNEVSCRVVQQHRPRSSRMAVTNSSLGVGARSEEHTSELQSRENLVCR